MPEYSEDEYGPSGSSGSGSDRPNRWEGPATTWQDMNREEINTLTSLNEIRHRDLSVHVYNTFALKQRHRVSSAADRPVPKKDINSATGETVRQDDDWLPQRSWTAWPLSGDRVPPDDFMRCDEDDGDELYTVRKPSRHMPSVALEDALGAAILRSAKEKFESRPWEDDTPKEPLIEDELDGEELDESDFESRNDHMASRASRSRSRSHARTVKRESEPPSQGTKDEQMDTDSSNSGAELEHATSLQERVLEPAVATDDQLSYDVLRPTVRSILTRLDTTLTILHHSRDAAVHYTSDTSSDSDTEDTDRDGRSQSRGSEPPAKKKRGRPAKPGRLPLRLRTPPRSVVNNEGTDQILSEGADGGSEQDTEEAPRTKRKVGRPRKVYPRLDGETDRDWAIRVAKLRKEPIPFFKDALDSDDPKSSASEAQPRRPRMARRKSLRSHEITTRDSEPKEARKRDTAERLELRDWKDILGAAALAGFPQAALDRAARRCADLFQESMELRTLNEVPLQQGHQDERVRYYPGMVPDVVADANDTDEHHREIETQSQTARHIRASSAASASSVPRGRSESRSQSRGRASTRSRSRSASVAGSHFCSVGGCLRAAEGFSRRANLVRHMRLVHGMDEDQVPTEVDSEDEMYGAVHVDGFLKPIKMRKGWRGDDVRRSESGSSLRIYAGRYSKRKGRNESAPDTGDEDRDVVMGED